MSAAGAGATALIEAAVDRASQSLVAAGDWLTGEQRRAGWLEARDARTNELDAERRRAISPHAVAGSHSGSELLPAAAVEVVHRIASDPGRLTRQWADEAMVELNDATYTELVGIAATSAVVDMYRWAVDGADEQISDALAGPPAQVRPDSVGPVGAWVHQTVGDTTANVSRSLSLVPVTNGPWVGLVDALYSRGPGFFDLSWDRALSRPQVELVAARTTAELECFY